MLLNVHSTTLCNYYPSLKRKTNLMTKRETTELEVKHPRGTKNSQTVGKMKKKNIVFVNIFFNFI